MPRRIEQIIGAITLKSDADYLARDGFQVRLPAAVKRGPS
jgi:hypothetical protein